MPRGSVCVWASQPSLKRQRFMSTNARLQPASRPVAVAFINICKASTPAVTLLVGLALGLERLSKPALVGTMLISLGVAMATASEVDTGEGMPRRVLRHLTPAVLGCTPAPGQPAPSVASPHARLASPPLHAGHMHWPSFLCFNASIVFEAFRMVLSERLLGRGRFDVFNALIYMGPITFAFLSIGSYAFEWNQGLSTQVRAARSPMGRAAGRSGRLSTPALHARRAHRLSALHGLPITRGRHRCLVLRRASPSSAPGPTCLRWRRAPHSWSTCSPSWPSATCRPPASRCALPPPSPALHRGP